MNFWSWFRQPSTITGVATVLGGITGTVAQMAGGSTNAAVAAGGAVFAATHLIVNDNTATQLSQIAVTAVGAATGGVPALIQAAPTLITEVFDLLRDMHGVPRDPATASAAQIASVTVAAPIAAGGLAATASADRA